MLILLEFITKAFCVFACKQINNVKIHKQNLLDNIYTNIFLQSKFLDVGNFFYELFIPNMFHKIFCPS